jgi:hypothetical protein
LFFVGYRREFSTVAFPSPGALVPSPVFRCPETGYVGVQAPVIVLVRYRFSATICGLRAVPVGFFAAFLGAAENLLF